MSKRVLVTGGAGFISSNFIRHLLDATPYEVVTLDALTYAGNLENLADVMSHPRLSFVHGDIRDTALVRELVEGVDVIVNAAAESHVEKSIEHGASEFVTTNVEGTQILLDAIRVTPVERFILISSSEVYGTAESAPMDEEHALKPRSPYAATKAGADRLAYSYWTTYDLPIVIVRPFNNYGPAPAPREGRTALHHAGARRRASDDPRRRACIARLALRRRRCRGDRARDRRADRATRRRGAEHRYRRRHLGERHRRQRARGARQAGRVALRTFPSGWVRSTATSARPRRPSVFSAGRPARASRTASSAPSRGIATMRRGGERFSRGKPAPTRPRGRSRTARAARSGARARPLGRCRRP